MNTNKEFGLEEIKEFLNQIELTLGQISEYDISDSIKNFIKEKFQQNLPNILLWEQIAFGFTENIPDNKSGGDTCFDLTFVSPNEAKEMVEYMSIQEITPEIISYWEDRAKESNHPIFKTRYSNLVWDFSERIKAENPHYSIAQIFIDSAIKIAEKDLHKYPTDIIKKLERALSLSLSINDKERIKKLVDTIISYEERISEDDKTDLWGFSYELLVKNKKVQLIKKNEEKIIRKLEEIFEKFLKENNHWKVKNTATFLIDYYYRNRNLSKTKNILLKLGSMIQKQADQASPLVASAWLEELSHIYLQYGLRVEADKTLIKIKELSKKNMIELKEKEVSIGISKEEIEKFINRLIKEDTKTALINIAINYIPRKDIIIKQLKDQSKKTPILYLTIRKILDNEGRIISAIGSLEEDIDGHIVFQISKNMQISSFLLRKTISALMKKFNLDAEGIVDYLYESSIFDERRKKFFIEGIENYLNNEFIITLNILIPQIEALIRKLAEKVGIPVLKISRYGGFHYKTLDDLLRDKDVINVLTEDICLYLRTLLTDQRGLNLRNNICHGISQIEDFNQINADLVFHALLCLALVREEEKGKEY
jgi:hypothetical protein